MLSKNFADGKVSLSKNFSDGKLDSAVLYIGMK